MQALTLIQMTLSHKPDTYFLLNGGAVSWCSFKQSVMAGSMCEAEYIVVLPLELALYSLEEEREMQHSSVSISLSFENQGINQVEDHAQVPRTCTNK